MILAGTCRFQVVTIYGHDWAKVVNIVWSTSIIIMLVLDACTYDNDNIDFLHTK